MQLIDIDKVRYRKHLNIVIVGFIGSLLVLSLLFGSLFISLFSNLGDVDVLVEAVNNAVGSEPESNFRYNLSGVIFALFVNAAILYRLKGSDFFTEVYYVWQIKQLQNLVYRKLKKIKAAAKKGEQNALIILVFYYESQLQVYQLDDNTITLDTIHKALQKVNDTMTEHGLTVTSDQFDKSLIALY